MLAKKKPLVCLRLLPVLIFAIRALFGIAFKSDISAFFKNLTLFCGEKAEVVNFGPLGEHSADQNERFCGYFRSSWGGEPYPYQPDPAEARLKAL